MTAQERHLHRDALARANGYRPVKAADDPAWAGARLPEAIDSKAAQAALRLRGLAVDDKAA